MSEVPYWGCTADRVTAPGSSTFCMLTVTGMSTVWEPATALTVKFVGALIFVVGRCSEGKDAVAGESEVSAARQQAQGDRGALRIGGSVPSHLPADAGVLREVVDGVRAGQRRRFVHILDDDVDFQFTPLAVGVGGLDDDLVVIVAAGVRRALVVGRAGEPEDAAGDGEVAPVRAAQGPGDVRVALGVDGGVGLDCVAVVLLPVVESGGAGYDWRLVKGGDSYGYSERGGQPPER